MALILTAAAGSIDDDKAIRAALQLDNNKYYRSGNRGLEEIQISENEIASDPDRHRSLRRHRSGSYIGILKSAPLNSGGEMDFLISQGLFSHTQAMR